LLRRYDELDILRCLLAFRRRLFGDREDGAVLGDSEQVLPARNVIRRGLAAALIVGVVALIAPRFASADPAADRQFICRTIFDAA
jgi:hypothetical protein